MIPRQAWLLPGRRQAIVLALLIIVGGTSLLLLPDRSRSYRAVARAVAPADAPDCVAAAPDHVGDEEVRDRVARRARVDQDEVAGSTEVVPAPAGAVLAVAFEADTAYAAQRGAYTTVNQSVSSACADSLSALLEDVFTTKERLDAAEAALRGVAVPSPILIAARDSAAADALETARTFDRQASVPERSSSVAAAEPIGSQRSGLEDVAVPAGVALCVAFALLVLRVRWRRAAAPLPA